jgi:hypothetical protein
MGGADEPSTAGIHRGAERSELVAAPRQLAMPVGGFLLLNGGSTWEYMPHATAFRRCEIREGQVAVAAQEIIAPHITRRAPAEAGM